MESKLLRILYRERGNTLVIMLMIVGVMAFSTTALFGNFRIANVASGNMINQKNNIYMADSARQISARLIQSYLQTVPQGTMSNADYSDQMTSYLRTKIADLLPTGYSVNNLQVLITAQNGSYQIPSGPFRGMMAPQTTVQLTFQMANGTGPTAVIDNIQTTMIVGQIGLHQFMYFLDLESGGFSPGGSMTIGGRVHSNGDICFSAENTGAKIIVSTVTAAGRVMHAATSYCGMFADWTQGSPVNAYISTDGGITNYHKLYSNNTGWNFSGCSHCEGTGLSWTSFAKPTWNGNAMDGALGVTKLMLPLPSNVKTQVGAFGTNDFDGLSNDKTLRLLIDPVFPGEDQRLSAYRFSYQADIRIIDGVWYKRDIAHPESWPGIPIWSDHPGSYVDPYGKSVGQDDLAALYSWPSLPKRYSYYGYNKTNQTLNVATPAVISYGTLNQISGGAIPGVWTPGYLLKRKSIFDGVFGADFNICSNDTNSAMPNGTTVPNPPSTLVGGPPANTLWLLPFDAPLSCNNGYVPGAATGLLNSTRSGFSDAHIMNWLMTRFADNSFNAALDPINENRVLPVNFDIGQFKVALTDTTAGELGSQLQDRHFNGIVWISATWPGSQNGLDPAQPGVYVPDLWPPQAEMSNLDSQTWMTSYQQQVPLPFPLCSTPPTGTNAGAGQPYDLTGVGQNRFFIPDCAHYGPGKQQAYPTAIRFINGSTVDAATFNKGLSLVSNLPVYVQGDINTNSDTSSATATPWTPVLIAGDQVTLFSNNWTDIDAPWTLGRPFGTGNMSPMSSPTTGNPPPNGTAIDTTYNMSIITGYTMGDSNSGSGYSHVNQGLHSLPGLLEDWRTANFTLNGSIVVGFYPVYNRGGRFYQRYDWFYSTYLNTYLINNRSIFFDPHLTSPSHQPPGTPLFDVTAVANWKIQ